MAGANSPAKAIRKRCLECRETRQEVRDCDCAGQCDLHPFRMGKSPFYGADKPNGIETNPVKAVRKHCIWCCKGQYLEVASCAAENCPIYPFRMGHNPFRQQRTESQVAHLQAVNDDRLQRSQTEND